MIECPKCHHQIMGMDVRHGQIMRSLDAPGLYARRTVAVCLSCGIGLEAAEFFHLSFARIREVRDPHEIDDIKRDLGLAEPLRSEVEGLGKDGV